MIQKIPIIVTLWLCALHISCNQTELGVFDNGAVVSAHPLASEAGSQILQSGGNAFDAAIAVQFALAVVYPGAGNIGGGGFLVYRTSDGKKGTLDYREKAPGRAHKNMYLDKDDQPQFEKSQRGELSAGVPGSVAGMWDMHQKLGKLPWEQLLQPAIDFATKGFSLTENEASKYNAARSKLIKYNKLKTNAKGTIQGDISWIPLVKNGTWKKGDTVSMPDLAKTLIRIQKEGRDGFYKGATAVMIEQQMKKNGGIVTIKDLTEYHTVWRDPLVFDYKDFQVISMGPPSSGGVTMSALAFGFDMLNVTQYPHNSPQYIHLKTEIEKRAYADRARYGGDPDFFNVPIGKLTSRSYLKKHLSGISLQSTTPSSKVFSGNFSNVTESEETTHISIVDEDRNAVSITTTLNRSFGSMVVVKGAGFLLNDEMDDFSIKAGVPNFFGLVGLGKANEIAPGKRMLSSMSPTIVEKDNELLMVLGTPGGSTIITTVFQVMINILDYHMTPQDAVNAGRVHSQWKPDFIYVEDHNAPKDTDLKILEGYDHKITRRGPIGRAEVILLKKGVLQTGADPRGDDTAAGY